MNMCVKKKKKKRNNTLLGGSQNSNRKISKTYYKTVVQSLATVRGSDRYAVKVRSIFTLCSISHFNGVLMCLSLSPFMGCRQSLYKGEGTQLFKLHCNILFTSCDLTLSFPFQSDSRSGSSSQPLWLSSSTLFHIPNFAGGSVGPL